MDAIREDKLGRALTRSLFAHGAVAVFIVLKSLVFPSNPIFIAPALRVDIVGLPDLLKKDLANVPKTLPMSDLQEKLAEAADQAKNIKPMPVEETVKPDEMVLNPKVAEKKVVKDIDKEKAGKLKSALARIRALERLKDKSEDDEKNRDDESVIIRGNQVSKGVSLSGDARENAQASYYDLIREALVEFWALPPWLGRQKLAAQIQIRIDRAGNVLSSKFIKRSGNSQFDDAILGTIKDSQPLPRPPKELISALSDDGVVVGFPL